jgi:hypothetical protein
MTAIPAAPNPPMLTFEAAPMKFAGIVVEVEVDVADVLVVVAALNEVVPTAVMAEVPLWEAKVEVSVEMT